jgi:hypothetical protein
MRETMEWSDEIVRRRGENVTNDSMRETMEWSDEIVRRRGENVTDD